MSHRGKVARRRQRRQYRRSYAGRCQALIAVLIKAFTRLGKSARFAAIATEKLSSNPTLIDALAAITPAQRSTITWAEQRHPGITHHLWHTNVLRGETFLIHRRAFPAMADIGDTFRRLATVGVLRPIRFAPSHSGAAFLGLQEGAGREARAAPHAGDAAHWEWEVIGRFDVLGLEV